MKLKRISATLLALAMTASTAAFAAGEDHPPVILDDEIIRQVNSGAMVGGPVVILDDEIIRQVNSIAMVGPVVILDDEVVRDVNRIAMVLGDGLTVVLDDELVRQINAGAMIGEGVETFSVEMDDSIMLEVNHQQGDIWLLSAPTGGLGISIPITIAAPTHYTATLTVNGELVESYEYDKTINGSWQTEWIPVNLIDLPSVPEGYVPMRALVQAPTEGGSANWYGSSMMSRFYFSNGDCIEVTFNDGVVTVWTEKDGNVVAEGVEPILLDGTTFLPISVFDYMEGYEAVAETVDGVVNYSITTPHASRPAAEVLAEKLKETAHTGMTMAASIADLEEFWSDHGFSADYVTEDFAAYLPMILSPDTLIVGKLAEGQEEALKAVLDSYYESMRETWVTAYAGSQYYKVENTIFVTEGDWFLFLIGENPEEVEAQFRSEIQAMEAEADGGIATLPAFPMMPML